MSPQFPSEQYNTPPIYPPLNEDLYLIDTEYLPTQLQRFEFDIPTLQEDEL